MCFRQMLIAGSIAHDDKNDCEDEFKSPPKLLKNN